MIPWTTEKISLLPGLAERISRANLEAVEPLARVGMRKDNAAAPPQFVAGRRGKTSRGKPVQTRPSSTPTMVAAGMRRCSLLELITANAAGRSATYTRPRRSFAATPRCQGFPTASTICGGRDTRAICRDPIAVHIG